MSKDNNEMDILNYKNRNNNLYYVDEDTVWDEGYNNLVENSTRRKKIKKNYGKSLIKKTIAVFAVACVMHCGVHFLHISDGENYIVEKVSDTGAFEQIFVYGGNESKAEFRVVKPHINSDGEAFYSQDPVSDDFVISIIENKLEGYDFSDAEKYIAVENVISTDLAKKMFSDVSEEQCQEAKELAYIEKHYNKGTEMKR